MLALSIRQPYVELILQGRKHIEYRTQNVTTMLGKRFWIYASKGQGARGKGQAVWSHDLSTMRDPPQWMIELAEQVKMIEPGTILPTGVIVGSAVIEKVEEMNDEVGTMNDEVKARTNSVHRSSFIVPRFRWHLAEVERARTLRRPTNHPQPVWFKPF